MAFVQRNRSTKAQLAQLISFMGRNPLFAQGNVEDKQLEESQWNELTENLNAIGTDNKKTVLAWQKTWADQVAKAKYAKDDILLNRREKPLDENERKILKAVNEEIVEPGKAHCSKNYKGEVNNGVPVTEDVPSSSNYLKENQEMVSKMIDIMESQTQLLNSILDTLLSMKTIIHSYEVSYEEDTKYKSVGEIINEESEQTGEVEYVE